MVQRITMSVRGCSVDAPLWEPRLKCVNLAPLYFAHPKPTEWMNPGDFVDHLFTFIKHLIDSLELNNTTTAGLILRSVDISSATARRHPAPPSVTFVSAAAAFSNLSSLFYDQTPAKFISISLSWLLANDTSLPAIMASGENIILTGL